jgi:uncharacterized protein YkwD
VPAHRKPTHRKKILAAAFSTALACSGVAFAVQGGEEPVASAPAPLRTTSAPSPSSSTATPAEEDERDVRPSRSATKKREPIAEKKARKADDTSTPGADTPSPVVPSEVADATTPVTTPTSEPTRTVRRQTDDSPAPSRGSTTSEGGILGGTNAARANAGLPALSTDSCLTDLAQRHAERLAASQSLRHQDLSTVMSVCGVSTAGENVAMNYTGPSAMVGQWMDSSGHRANILDGRFTLIGIGTAQARDGSWYGVQVFGAD